MKIDWPSPVSGVVIDKKKVVEGQKIVSGPAAPRGQGSGGFFRHVGPGHEVVDAGLGPAVDELLQHVGRPGEGIDSV